MSSVECDGAGPGPSPLIQSSACSSGAQITAPRRDWCAGSMQSAQATGHTNTLCASPPGRVFASCSLGHLAVVGTCQSQALIKSGGPAQGSKSCLFSRFCGVTWPCVSCSPVGDSVIQRIKSMESIWQWLDWQFTSLFFTPSLAFGYSETDPWHCPPSWMTGQKLPIQPGLWVPPHPSSLFG